jgi:hypothetical protein
LLSSSPPASVSSFGACTFCFKESPPLPVRLPSRGCLDLAPIATLARLVGSIAALAHHALEAVLLGHAEQRLAVVEWFSQDRRAAEPAQKGPQAPLSRFQRPVPQILAVEHQEIERPDMELRRIRRA